MCCRASSIQENEVRNFFFKGRNDDQVLEFFDLILVLDLRFHETVWMPALQEISV